MAKRNPKSEIEHKSLAAERQLHPDDLAYVKFLLTRQDECFVDAQEFLDLVRRLHVAAEYRAAVTDDGAVEVREYFRQPMTFALLEDRRHDKRRADRAAMGLDIY